MNILKCNKSYLLYKLFLFIHYDEKIVYRIKTLYTLKSSLDNYEKVRTGWVTIFENNYEK